MVWGPRYSPLAGTICAVLSSILSSPSSAGDRLVRVFFPAYEQPVLTGGIVPANKIHTLLFIKEKCQMPVVGAENMFRAWRVAGAYQLGCWFPTLNDEYTYINAIGESFHSQGDFWQTYPHGMLHDDGSVTITEPNFDSRTWSTAMQRQILQQHLHATLDTQKP